MIEHVTIHVEDLDEARGFYEALLAPLGYEVTRRVSDHDDGPRIAFGRDRRAQLWLVEESMAHEGLVIALTADDEAAVDAFRSAAEDAGADDVSEAETDHAGKYAASAKDANGNRIVAVAGGAGRGMIDHVQLVVSDFGRTLRFYEQLLEPLEVSLVARELDHEDGPRVAFGQGGEPSLWLTEEGDPQSSVAIGFSAANKRQVDEFYVNAKDAGGRKIQAAGVRDEVGPDYYVAGASDPDNNRIEAVHDGEHGLAPVAAVKTGGDKLAEAAALQRWEAERAQAKAAEMAEAEARSGRGFASLSTTPVTMAAMPKKAAPKAEEADEEEEDLLAGLGDDAEGDADDLDLAALGLDDDEGEKAASGDDGEIDWAALGLDDDETSTDKAETTAGDDDEIDWAALGLDDDDSSTEKAETAAGDDDEIDWAALGLDDDDAETSASSDDEELDLSALGLDDEEEEAPKPAAKPAKKEISKSAMGMDFGGKL
ncbi:VOC family protein [Sphingomonas jatrophae]|uniref:Glyoxalase/Bleomycin resistance protein/Dioxygenase superfamily protein n=1 Tax=Sphingomonas jatrophae TaxID=1166337 RepID=A0A1I6JJ73_9SPHN|nr:VOC family protein [Sphingomonas jatrophae]SFR79066.1 Glyoxalase/Bleomycin resistance protein/Dioxygenase superfamily protein [Sphingomonas jatrophae]